MPGCALFAQQVEKSVYNDVCLAKYTCRFVYSLGKTDIRLELGDNAEVLSQLDSFIRSAIIDSQLHIRRIRLTSYSSIEGPYTINGCLAYDRVESFHDYLRTKYPELYRYPMDLVWVAEDWDGLLRLVRESGLEDKEEALDIIRNVNIRSFDAREALLAKLNGGRLYWYMQRNFFNQLRRVEIEIEYDITQPRASYEKADPLIYNILESERDHLKTDPEIVSETLDAAVNRLPEAPESYEAPSGYRVLRDETLRRPLFAIKTNALLWAGIQSDFSHTAPVANAALEYFINSHWSVELGAMYSYWHYNSDREFQGISGYRLEPRYRLAFPGEWLEAYVGVYGRSGDYDSQTIDKNDPQSTINYTHDYWDAGLSAGLTFCLGRGWAVEAGARAGYVKTNAIEYTRDGQYNLFKDRKPYNKMRVTDLNVSFIYRFR